ncbi:MAG: glycosyltransferase [Acetobacterales bacterium]
MANTTSDILVFEPDPRGHAQEWLEHLIDWTEAHPGAPRLTLVVAQGLSGDLRHRASEVVRIITLSPRECRLCNHRSLAVSAMSRWWAMRRHLAGTGATHGFFLALDHLALPLALSLPTGGKPVSGILFRPTSHYHEFGSGPGTWRERVRDLHKQLLTRLMLRNPRVWAVYSIDPFFPDYAARHYAKGDKVVELGDPAFPPPEPDEQERALVADLPSDRTTFVLFGEITWRKGPLPLLAALARMPEEQAARCSVVLAGRIDPPIRDAVLDAVRESQEARPGLRLKVVDRRLAAGEITALIQRSDAVLVPYQRFVGSSGVLLWAAQLRRPVICQAYGLVGELTRRYRLGAAVDSSDPDALSRAIAGAVRNGAGELCDPEMMARFVADRTPEAFSGTLLSGLAEPVVEGAESPADGDYDWSQRFPV